MQTTTRTLAFTLVCLFCSLASADYLMPELRTRVEALKAEYRANPTTPETHLERAAVAWDWINAYSLTGRSLPVNITTAVRPALPYSPSQKIAWNLDYYIKELILLDEDPDAIGELKADLGPFEARSFVTLRQTYTVGSKAIQLGGGFLIAGHFQPWYGSYQVADPGADNYVSITTSNTLVRFVPDQRPLSGMHGGFRGVQPTLFFKVSQGTLNSGDEVVVTYGDTTQGSRGWLMGFPSTDFLPVPLYVDFEGTGHNYALPIQPIRVGGTDLAGVHAFAPSVVRPDELFELSVRAQDRFYNRAKAPLPGFTVYANDELLAQVPPSDKAITVVEDISFEQPGVYRITVRSDDGSIEGVGNPILVDGGATKVFWGDTHGHSGFAEGIGTPDRFMQWARDDARLDFVTHSEHDIWMDDHEWKILKDSVVRYSVPGRFIAYLGYEWTTNGRFGGHHNVLFRDVDNRSRVATQLFPTTSALYEGLRRSYDTGDVLVIPHAHQSGDFRQSDPELQNLVEIMSQHGTFEWFGQRYVDHGHQVGFIAASDNHLSQPGYTSVGGFMQRGGLAAVRTNDGSRDGMFNAMKSRSTYATTGDRIILDVQVNGAAMGTRTAYAEQRVITGRVIGTGPLDQIALIKNGQQIWQQNYLDMKDGRYADEETFYLSFESGSMPMHPQDNARGSRGWQGTLDVKGAEIVAFEATDFFNPETTHLKQDQSNSNRLQFMTRSRGDASTIRLKLKNIKRSASIALALQAVPERGSPTFFRRPPTLPAATVNLKFRNLVAGELQKVLPVDIYDDRIRLRRINSNGPSDVTFEHADTGGLQGDYYYLRVKQANDAMAWSSPTWVGGIPPL